MNLDNQEELEIFSDPVEGQKFVFTYVIYSKKKLKEFQEKLRTNTDKTS